MDLLSYYRARAREYEQVYAKPERQADLAHLHRIVPETFASRRVLEVACGTGYWTRRIAAEARAVVGVDLAPETLVLAEKAQPREYPATFIRGDAFRLHDVPGDFDAAFIGFWWSHILRSDLARFLNGLHGRIGERSRVLILDNRYVDGSNWPISRFDEHGNSYQHRRLDDGTECEVLKNFPTPATVHETLSTAGADRIVVHELTYYWYATYEVAAAPNEP